MQKSHFGVISNREQRAYAQKCGGPQYKNEEPRRTLSAQRGHRPMDHHKRQMHGRRNKEHENGDPRRQK